MNNMKKTIHAEASEVIDAPAATLYAIIADYRVGHPAIVPKPTFGDLTVEVGGKGAGTVIRGTLTAFGKTYPLHQRVTEPEPGHVLKETDIESGQYTTFTFEPLNNGQQTRVTIASEFPYPPGLVGFMQNLMLPSFARKLYIQELQNLAAYVQTQAVSAPAY